MSMNRVSSTPLQIEREEEKVAQQDPEKQCFHLCIVNLVIGTLYCAKVNKPFLWAIYPLYLTFVFSMASLSLQVRRKSRYDVKSMLINVGLEVPLYAIDDRLICYFT